MSSRWRTLLMPIAAVLAVGLVWWSPSLTGSTHAPGSVPPPSPQRSAPPPSPTTPAGLEDTILVLTESFGGTLVTVERAGVGYRLRLMEPWTPRSRATCGEPPARSLRLCARTADRSLLLLTVQPGDGAGPTAARILRDPRLQHAWALGRPARRERLAAVLETAVDGRHP